MKALFLLAALAAAPAYAGGISDPLDDPEVIQPAEQWGGPYVSLTYGRSKSSEESVECFKLGTPYACDDPIFLSYPQYKEERVTTLETDESIGGLLLGYRFDLGTVVPGVELGLFEEEVLPAVTLGLDLGQVLPYAVYSPDGAAIGFEAKLSKKFSAGVRHSEDFTAMTVSWEF